MIEVTIDPLRTDGGEYRDVIVRAKSPMIHDFFLNMAHDRTRRGSRNESWAHLDCFTVDYARPSINHDAYQMANWGGKYLARKKRNGNIIVNLSWLRATSLADGIEIRLTVPNNRSFRPAPLRTLVESALVDFVSSNFRPPKMISGAVSLPKAGEIDAKFDIEYYSIERA